MRLWFHGCAAVVVCCFIGACGYKTSPRPMGTAIPGPVGLVDCSAYPDRILLKWEVPHSNTDGTDLKDLSGFKVYRSNHKIGEACPDCKQRREVYANVDIDDPANAAIVGSEVIYTDRKVTAGNVYAYRVAPYNLKGREGPASTEVEVEFQDAPQPPRSLDARTDSGKVILRWTPPADQGNIRSYRIYRGTENRPEALKVIDLAQAKETRYEDRNVEKDTTYFYQVRSLMLIKGIALESGPSIIAAAVIKPVGLKAPAGVNASLDVPAKGIAIFWQPVKAENVKVRYNVYRSVQGRQEFKPVKSALDEPKFVDKGLTRGLSYSYSVTAFPEGREKEESDKSAPTNPVKFNP